MKPTLNLRWHDSEYKGQKGSPIRTESNYGEQGFLVLQQWWENKDGKGEWRDIPTDYSYDMKRGLAKDI